MATKLILRSPRYPTIGLREAIEKAKAVFDNDRRNKIPKDLVAEHLGYSGLNGASLGVISALTKYGLLEGGRDSMWVTERAVVIFMHEKGDQERVQAVKDASQEPELFRAINEHFSGKASDAALRAFLVTKREFLPSSADKLIKSYRETMEFFDEEVGSHDDEFTKPSSSALLEKASSSSDPVNGGVIGQVPAATTSLSNAATAISTFLAFEEREWLRGPLSRDVSYRIVVKGEMGPKEISKLIKLLQSQQEILEDDSD